MIVEIQCATCGEILGTLDKPVITDADRELFQTQTVCSLGHGAAVTLEEITE